MSKYSKLYMTIPAKELAAKFHELSEEIGANKEKEGWTKLTGKLAKERYMVDAIGHYRFDNWYDERKKGLKSC